jgi:hypothetical protein
MPRDAGVDVERQVDGRDRRAGRGGGADASSLASSRFAPTPKELFTVPRIHCSTRHLRRWGTTALALALSVALLPVLPHAVAAAGHAIRLNGSTQFVTFGRAPALGASTFTLELWFMRTGAGVPTSTGTQGALPNVVPLLTKGRAQSDGTNADMNYFLGIDATTGTLAADFEEGAGGPRPGLNHPIRGSTVVTSNVWHHAAVTYNGSSWALYLDGALDGTLAVNRPPRSDSIQHAALGSAMNSKGAAKGFFAGLIDEARVWNVARSASEVASTKDAEITTPTTGLVARWGLDEGTGTVVADSIGTTNGTAKKQPAWADGVTFVPPNHQPDAPAVVAPADGATDVGVPATLDVTVSDPDGDPMDVTFFGRPAGSSGSDFTLVEIPDPQHYPETQAKFAIEKAQMHWVVDSSSSLNTVFVAGVGDMVQTVTNATQWSRADQAQDILDNAGVPNSVVPGNHDMTAAGASVYYDQYFPPSRYQGQPWYGGYLGDPSDAIPDPANRGNKDNYVLFDGGGMSFLLISLEIDLPVYAVQWAQDVIDAYPDRHVVISTHRWLWEDGTRWAQTLYRHDTPLLTPEQTWQQLVKPNCQVFMVIMGHEHAENRRTDVNDCDQPVFQLLADYQARPNGGDGWLRYYTFEPSQNQIEAYTYSPTRNGGLGEFENDADSRFTLDWPMGGTGSYQVIGSVSGVASGADVSVQWAGLDPGTTYEWYAVANDGDLAKRNGTSAFTTAP